MRTLVPSPDPVPLPAPPWVLEGLLLATLFLHLLPMSLMLGGGALMVISDLRGRRDERHRRLARMMAQWLPVLVAFTITFGVAPLLFVQVLYGPVFFSASILMAWPWLSIIGLMLFGYYGYYWHAYQFDRLGRRAVWVAAISTGLFLIVGLLFSSNMALMLAPERWGAIYGAGGSGFHWDLRNPTIAPRYLHMVVASLALSGLGLAVLGGVQRRADAAFGAWVTAYGLRWFTGATWVQFGSGLWFLAALPAPIRSLFLGEGVVETGALVAAVALALASVSMVRRRLGSGVVAILGTIGLMVVVRDRLRVASLAPSYAVAHRAAAPQVLAIGLFAVTLACGIAAIVWMLRTLVHPTGQETAESERA
jgi:hypothetical protein